MAMQGYARKACHVHARTLTGVLGTDSPTSFGAFAGTAAQRACIAIRCAAPALGRLPLVLIHNDAPLEAGISQLATRMGIATTLAGGLARNAPTAGYDPLYGLDRLGVARALGVSDDARLASRVTDYLAVMEALHAMDGGAEAIGAHPYRLQLLQSLARLNCESLESIVLQHLPEPMRKELIPRMTVPGDQREVADLVDSLATRLSCLVRPTSSPALATRSAPRSAISTALEGGFTGIGMPTRDDAVLGHIAVELDALLRRGAGVMLVVSGLDVSGSPLADLILSQRPHGRLVVGLACDLATRVVESADEVASLLSMLSTSVVRCCPNVEVASTFSRAFGTYDRHVLESRRGRSREFLSILPRLDRGTNERIVTEQNVRPEDLVGNPHLALVCGTGIPEPILVEHFDETR